MTGKLIELFNDKNLVEKIKKRLPYLFQLAELESSRAGKTGMEVGSVRERIIMALLIYRFGEANIETEIPITESEIDAKLFGEPVSVKTITGKRLSGVKLNKKWVDFWKKD
ncbi:MAG: ThaI family type II restriction endonuclease [Candidatus Omnitrophota bacterium]